MTIRVATVTDIPKLHALMLAAFEMYKEESVPSSALKETQDMMVKKMGQGEQALILETETGEAVAMVRFELTGDQLYFFRLSVPPVHQVQGYAKRLLIELERVAILNNKKLIRCRVRTNVTKNVLLYQNFGYLQYDEQVVLKPSGQSVLTALLEKPVKHHLSK